MVRKSEVMPVRAAGDQKTDLIDLSSEELLERVGSFMSEPLPPECMRFTDTFRQGEFDKWAGQAFKIKDHIKTLINRRLLSTDDSLKIAEGWDCFLGYGASDGSRNPSIPYNVYAGEMQLLNEPRKPEYHYTYTDFHNSSVRPEGPNAGYWREGLGLDYTEDHSVCMGGLKKGRLAGRGYSPSSLQDMVGLVTEDAYLVVSDDGRLKIKVPVTSINSIFGRRQDSIWTDDPQNLLLDSDEDRPDQYRNVFSYLLGSGYKGDPEDIAGIFFVYRDTWRQHHDPYLQQKIIEYIKNVIAGREASEMVRREIERKRQGSWQADQDQLTVSLDVLVDPQ